MNYVCIRFLLHRNWVTHFHLHIHIGTLKSTFYCKTWNCISYKTFVQNTLLVLRAACGLSIELGSPECFTSCIIFNINIF